MGARDPHAYGWPRPATEPNEESALRLPQLPAADPGLRVGVIDTGVHHNRAGRPHPWLSGHVSYLEEDVETDDDNNPAVGHGSFVAGVVLRHAPEATVMMRKAIVEGPEDDGQVVAAIRSLRWAGVKLINLSFGGSLFEHRTPPLIAAALDEPDDDVVLVAAAANNASPLHTYPAARAGVLSVGATDAEGEIAEFSAHGSWISLYAVGQDVLGPYRDEFVTWSGASFAAAAVTGRIARLMGDDGLSATNARERLLTTCVKKTVWGVNGSREVDVLL
ncbi:hypothetical protein BBK82_36595 [Lentzea guizhouensis]|uniref:Peptidase S8/S53 domain-containing protein n=1 Tax=Lentzea guizhouensis TaxID=1586287 RepID=A0A1B2HSI7_9PSEU|nr:S8 family serine peptidase [Lentzea guizhouensis]ANZ40700.1 hypothetical protein BBK82_36595 [Lentzea guizhouensis]